MTNWVEINSYTIAQNRVNAMTARARELNDTNATLTNQRLIEGVQTGTVELPITLAVLSEALPRKKAAEGSLTGSSKETLH
jgi:hypothetical protein